MNTQRLVRTLLFSLSLHCASVHAGLIDPSWFTGTPDDSWAYSELLNAGQGGSIDYFPTSPSEWAGAVFQGYVLDPNLIVPYHGWYGSGYDTLQVFQTYVSSSMDVILDLWLLGDDGHSLFIDNVFITGGGFNTTQNYTLALDAGETRKVTVAGYNGPGEWIIHFGVLDANGGVIPNDLIPIAGSAPGVVINAAPEPATAVLLGSGVFLLMSFYRRRA